VLQIATLIVAGEQDFIPVEIARELAQAMPRARLVVIQDCGHFAYMECAATVRQTIDDQL